MGGEGRKRITKKLRANNGTASRVPIHQLKGISSLRKEPLPPVANS